MKKILALVVAVAMLAAVGYALIGNPPVEKADEPEVQNVEPEVQNVEPEPTEPEPEEPVAPVALSDNPGVPVALAGEGEDESATDGPESSKTEAEEKKELRKEEEAKGIKWSDVAPDDSISVDRDSTTIAGVESYTVSGTTAGATEEVITIRQDADGNVTNNAENITVIIDEEKGTFTTAPADDAPAEDDAE